MALILDIILVSILAFCVYFGWRRGFVKSLGGFLIYIVAFGFANSFYRPFSALTLKIPFLRDMVSDTVPPDLSGEETFLDKVKTIFGFIGENSDDVENAAKEAQALLKYYVADFLASVFAFLLIFIICVVLLKLLLFLFDKFVAELPVIKQMNGFFGGVIGLLTGFIWTWALSNLFVRFFLPFLNEKWPEIFVWEIADSFVVSLCTTINPITYLFHFINWIS